MYEVVCINLENNEEFNKVFWNKKAFDDFIRKCNYSKKIKVKSIVNNERWYD